MTELLRRMSPVRIIMAAFLAALWIGIGLLMLPASHRVGTGSTFMEALFTATSAICVTGLATVDTGQHWSGFGQAVILGLIQIGGFGVMTLASLVGLAVLGKLSLKSRMTTAVEVKQDGLNDLRHVVNGILRITAAIELTVAVVLAVRLRIIEDLTWPTAAWRGLFHAVSAFNNAGFSLQSDSMTRYVADPWICVPVMLAIVLGGLGYPVLMQLRRLGLHRQRWSMNTHLVLWMTAIMLVVSSLYVLGLEWNNPSTLGPLSTPAKILAGCFQAVQTRTAGFNSVDTGALYPATWLGMDIFMFIGGGPAGTAGGIKVTTLAVLFFVIRSEVRGDAEVTISRWRLPRGVHRQAITVALLSAMLVVTATVVIMVTSSWSLDAVLFEVVSAFGTVGLSTGITPDLGVLSQLILCVLMVVGRLGPITIASALALRTRTKLYQLPSGRPIIG